MTAYIIRRLLQMIPVTLLVMAMVFVVFRLIPGDPVQFILGADPNPAAVEALRRQFGLDKPIPVQFVIWLGNVVQAPLRALGVTAFGESASLPELYHKHQIDADAVLGALERPPEGLRVGLVADDSACGKAASETAALLESLGHEIGPLEIGVLARDLEDAARVFTDVIAANLAFEVDRMAPVPQGDELEPITWAAVERGRGLEAAALVAASRAMLETAHRMAALFEGIDLLLTPALAAPPPPLGSFPTDHGDLDGHF